MSKNIKLALGGLLIAIVAAAAFYFGYWVKTPQYSLYIIENAIVKHDVATFNDYVDTDRMFSKLFDDCLENELSINSEHTNPLIFSLVQNIKATVVPIFSVQAQNFVKSGTIEKTFRLVGDATGRGAQLADGMYTKMGIAYLQFKAVDSVEKKDNEAIVTISIYDKQVDRNLPIRLKMIPKEDGKWRLVEVFDVKVYLQARKEAIAAKLAQLNKPIRDKIAAAVKLAEDGEKAPKIQVKALLGLLPVYTLNADFTLTNTGSKEILAVDGVMTLLDEQGNATFSNPFEAGRLEAGQTRSFNNSWPLNPFMASQDALTKEAGKALRGSFELNNVIFKDGTVLTLLTELPDPKEEPKAQSNTATK